MGMFECLLASWTESEGFTELALFLTIWATTMFQSSVNGWRCRWEKLCVDDSGDTLQLRPWTHGCSFFVCSLAKYHCYNRNVHLHPPLLHKWQSLLISWRETNTDQIHQTVYFLYVCRLRTIFSPQVPAVNIHPLICSKYGFFPALKPQTKISFVWRLMHL